jgi:hypothetical protein
MAATPSADRCSRWSHDSAPYCAASAAPPWSLSCSACSLTGRPSCRAARNTRSVCSGLKAMWSQNTSTASTRPGLQLAGQPADQRVDVVVGPAFEFRRHRVRAQRGGAHRQRQFAAQPACHRQAARFRAAATGRSPTSPPAWSRLRPSGSARARRRCRTAPRRWHAAWRPACCGCRRRPARSARRWRRAAAVRIRPRGRRHRPGGCGSRPARA